MRAPPDADLAVACRNGKRDQAGRHHRAGVKDQVALRHIKAGRPDKLTVLRHLQNRYARAVILAFGADVFLQDDRIRALRHHGAGEDSHGDTCLDAAVPWPARSRFTEALKGRADSWTVAAADSIAVHGRHRRRRQA